MQSKASALAKSPEKAEALIAPFRSAVLSIEWEINDAIMEKFTIEARNLVPQIQEDPDATMMLKLVSAVGDYIGKRRAQAHGRAFGTLKSMFEQFETVLLDQTLDKAARQQVVAKAIEEFKDLKARIAGRKTKSAPMSAPAPSGTPAPPAGISDELKDYVNSRVKATLAPLEKKIARLENLLSRQAG